MELRPLPGDPDEQTVRAMFDLRGELWHVAAPGGYQSAAVETMKADGSQWQRLVALEWPGRVNNSDELVTVRLLIAPEDAMNLALVLAHTGSYLAHLDAT